MDESGREPASPPSAVFFCGACGKVAATATLVPPGQPDQRLMFGPGRNNLGTWVGECFPDHAQLSVGDGALNISHGPVPMAALTAALETADAAALFAIDPECAPFWCPDCAASYCRDHYETLDVWDGGFFDCVQGICPKGHVRILID